MTNFDRQYRLSVGPPGQVGFEVGAGDDPLNISFGVQRSELDTSNSAKVSVWNLSPAHRAVVEQPGNVLTLRAGYGNTLPVIINGDITFGSSLRDGDSDVITNIELVDGRRQLRDTYPSLGYQSTVNNRKIIEDTAAAMGVAVVFSHDATFAEFPTGFSYVGAARGALDKACGYSSLSWSIQNGVLQVKRTGGAMSTQAYLLSTDTGLIGWPEKVQVDNGDTTELGWDVQYQLNGAIDIGDLVQLKSKAVSGTFRVYSLEISGERYGEKWVCYARLLEVK